MKAPLADVKVLDLGHYVAGPFGGAMLADMGASVVKVEPLKGDPMRHMGSPSFIASNRGKKAVAVDLKSAAGTDIIVRACEWADVVIHNMRPKVARRLGIDAATLRSRRPQLIVMESSAYGPSGPEADQPGFDILLQARTGHLIDNGGRSGPPLPDRLIHVDYGTGMVGSLGVLAALVGARRRGSGASMSTSLLDTAMFHLAEYTDAPDSPAAAGRTLDRTRTGFRPTESLYRAKNGWLAVVARGEQAATALLDVLAISVDRPSAKWGEPEREAIARAVARWDCSALVEALTARGLWAEECIAESRDDLVREPVLAARGSIFRARNAAHERTTEVGMGTDLDGTFDPAGRGRVPDLGEHTAEMLEVWGFSEADIQRFRADGIVR